MRHIPTFIKLADALELKSWEIIYSSYTGLMCDENATVYCGNNINIKIIW